MNRRFLAAACAAALCLLSAPLPARSAQPLPPIQQEPSPTAPAPAAPTGGAEGANPEATRRTWLPLIQQTSPDVTVAAIEVTQAVQTPDNSVPLVRGRPTVARIYLQASGQPVGNLTLTLSATRNGVALSGSPLRRSGLTAQTTYSRSRRADSVNLLLPATWLSGNVVLTAQLSGDGVPTNNTRRQALSFRSVAPLALTIVPIRYVHAPTNQTYAPQTAFAFPDSVRAMFPVPSLSIHIRNPLTWRGDITNDSGVVDVGPWQDLLSQVHALKRSDKAPDATVYVAILPDAVLENHRIYLAGIGSSARAVVSFDVNLIPAHEIGHGLGRRHAPCGGPSGVDPNYPYAGAVIGAYGYNTAGGTIYTPSATDIMSYCEEWVSDYTYVGMLNDQVAVAGTDEAAASAASTVSAAGALPALMVRASFDANGAAGLLPIYALSGAPTVASGPYTVALVAADGATLAEHAVAIDEAEEKGVTARWVNALVPLPDAATVARIAAVELRRDGAPIARRALHTQATLPAATVVVEGETLRIERVEPTDADTPALIRHLHGAGATTLALDVAASSLALPAGDLAGGPGSIEVIPADTLPTSATPVVAAALPLELPDRPPRVQIGAPALAPMGAGIVLSGYASDPEGGTLALEWRIDGALAAGGPLLQIEELGRALTVELRATDATGAATSATLLLAPMDNAPDEATE